MRAKLREGEILWFWCLIVYTDFMDTRVSLPAAMDDFRRDELDLLHRSRITTAPLFRERAGTLCCGQAADHRRSRISFGFVPANAEMAVAFGRGCGFASGRLLGATGPRMPQSPKSHGRPFQAELSMHRSENLRMTGGARGRRNHHGLNLPSRSSRDCAERRRVTVHTLRQTFARRGERLPGL
jgi:hypothetical protein